MHRASTVPSRLDETATTTEAETATETETEPKETATETATATAETETATATDTATATETETETETETDTATATETETTETALHPHAAGPRAAIAPEPSEPENPSSSLREEIALLDRALRAREAGDVALARRLLRSHEARFPEGTLVPERERLRGEIDRAGERSESPSP
jgi:TolA-binding protein